MEIVSLSVVFEPIFWEHVNQDILHYFFFALDWKYNRDETKILLALKGKQIDGMMLVYRQKMAQLRGSRDAIKALLEHLDLKTVELQTSKEHKQRILEKYEPMWSHELVLMVLHKDDERLQISHPIVKLEVSDAERIAAIMKKVNPESWGEVTVDQIVEAMSSEKWVGIKVNGELVSIGRTRLTEEIGHIVTTATPEIHRNKGYASSVVAYLIKLIFEKVSIAIIYVLSDNPSAIRVYEKVGFRHYKTYFFMRGKKRQFT